MKNKYFNRAATWWFFPALCLALASCELFEYSPYEVRLKPEERQINEQHIARILAQQPATADTLTIALTADTQGFYADNDDMVNHMNQRNDIAFVLHAGDITDYGLLKEFRWIHKSLDRLKVPYVAVIGNHDAVGNGQEVYKAMFGKFDFSFAVGTSKFIFLNTNFLEFDLKAPDLDWLEAQLKDRAKYEAVFVISHIPPDSFEFGEHHTERYQQLLKQYRVTLSVHGHTHNYNYYKLEEEGVDHLTVAATNAREYIVMQIVGEAFTIERVNF